MGFISDLQNSWDKKKTEMMQSKQNSILKEREMLVKELKLQEEINKNNLLKSKLKNSKENKSDFGKAFEFKPEDKNKLTMFDEADKEKHKKEAQMW